MDMTNWVIQPPNVSSQAAGRADAGQRRAAYRPVWLSAGLGVTSYKRNQEGLKNSHDQHASYDRCNSKRQRVRLQEHETAKKSWDRSKDSDPMCGYFLSARLAIDRAPRT
jgi:hypothetical protein